MISIYPLPAFTDNYIWILRKESSIVVVDPGDATPVIEHCKNEGYSVADIIVTHHHADHIGGVDELVAFSANPNLTVFGPTLEAQSVVTHPLKQDDTITLFNGHVTLSVMDIPGHTLGHIAYFWNQSPTPWLFCGDTLFSGGCGRIFEGTPDQMYASLQALSTLPPATQVCCAHEYTQSNMAFAHQVLPDDPVIQRFYEDVQNKRARGEITLPATLSNELAINIFLRSHEPALYDAAQRHSGKPMKSDAQTFAALRAWKDTA